MAELYARYEHLLAAAQLAFAMLGMGALLAPRDFMEVFRQPRALSVGLGVQLVLVPLLALGLSLLLGVDEGIAAGLVLVAAVPGGTMSNLMTYFAAGNIALSVSLTAVTTVGSLVTTPLLLQLLAGAQLPSDFEMPTRQIAQEIAVALIGPLALGVAIGTQIGEHRERFSRIAIGASLFCILLLVIGAVGGGRLDPVSYGMLEQSSIVLLALLLFAASVAAVRVAGLEPADRTAIAIEATLRNTNLGILVKASMFPAAEGNPIGDGMLYALLTYGGLQILVAALPIGLRRFGRSV